MKSADRRLALLLLVPSLVLIVVINIAPALLAARDSLYDINMATQEGPFVGIDNYATLILSDRFLSALLRSIVWVIGSVAGQTILGLGIALLLHRSFRGRTLARGLVLLPYIVPVVVVALVWRFILNETFGLVSLISGVFDQGLSLLGRPDSALPTILLINIWRYTPFMVILFLARLQTAPIELYDAAKIDGARPDQTFRYVTLPWLAPVLMIAILLRVIFHFADFDLVYLMAFGGPLGSTTTLPVLVRDLAFEQLRGGLASAVGTTMAAILLGVYLVYLRLYRRSEERLN